VQVLVRSFELSQRYGPFRGFDPKGGHDDGFPPTVRTVRFTFGNRFRTTCQVRYAAAERFLQLFPFFYSGNLLK
jgi:hypothetical protein